MEDELLRLGNRWHEHYRGTRYHFNPMGEIWWQMPGSEDRLRASSGHEHLVKSLLNLRPEGGSFRITETRAVITKSDEDVDDWVPLYVGEYEIPLLFDGVDVQGVGLKPFDLWTAFYDGARYSYRRNEIWWRNGTEGLYQRSPERMPPDIERRLLRRKPQGGSFRVTENGKVLTLIQPQPLSPQLRSQYEALTNVQQNILHVKVQGTDMLPVYLGEYFDGFSLLPPERLTDPLSPDETKEMLEFLHQYSDAIHGREEDLDFFQDEPDEDWR